MNSLGTSYSLDRLCADSFGVAGVIGKGEGGGQEKVPPPPPRLSVLRRLSVSRYNGNYYIHELRHYLVRYIETIFRPFSSSVKFNYHTISPINGLIFISHTLY